MLIQRGDHVFVFFFDGGEMFEYFLFEFFQIGVFQCGRIAFFVLIFFVGRVFAFFFDFVFLAG